MAIKGSNMIVRVGADMSGLIGEFKKSGRATENFAKQASDALRQATLSEANLKKAMAQGGKNSYIVNLTDQIRELEQEQKALKAAGFGWGYEGFENNDRSLAESAADGRGIFFRLLSSTLYWRRNGKYGI